MDNINDDFSEYSFDSKLNLVNNQYNNYLITYDMIKNK